MEYDDGGAPPTEIINKWLDVVATTFHNAPDRSGPNGSDGPTIAVHCVAGLGRAPVLVAIALIEYGKVRLLHIGGARGTSNPRVDLPLSSLLLNTCVVKWKMGIYIRGTNTAFCSSCLLAYLVSRPAFSCHVDVLLHTRAGSSNR